MDLKQKINYTIRLLGGASLLLGILNLIGWYFGIVVFTEFIPGLTPMVYNTGLCFALLGLSLIFSSFHKPGIVRVLSIIPLIIGFSTLIQYYLKIDTGLDTLFFVPPSNPLIHFPGRMSPNTALAFFLSSCALLILSNTSPKQNWISACLSSIFFGFGFSSLIGYLFNINPIKFWKLETSMALHTSAGFIILALGVFLSSLTYTVNKKVVSWIYIPLTIASLSIFENLWFSLLIKNILRVEEESLFGIISIAFFFNAFAIITVYLVYKCINITFLLETAKLQLQVTSENRNRLLHHVSHEIKNPLNSMIGFATLLLEKIPEGEDSELIKSIQSSGAHILNLTKDLLAIARLESGHLELDQKEFKLHPWIDEIVNLSANRAKVKSIEFSFKIDEDLPEIMIGDYSKIAQIIFNFIDNALKFTPKGKKIDFQLTCQSKEGISHILEISVKDEGPGIPEGSKRQIFEPFKQLENDQKTQGSGLGLAICSTYINLMKGEIGVISDGKNGSTFFAKIPLLSPSQQTSMQSQRKS